MEPLAFHDGRVELYGEDCLAVLKVMPDCFVDAVITDPPYHLTSIVKRFGGENAAPCKVGQTGAYARASRGFMGQQWDGGDIAFRPDVWRECLRVLKPGGHLASFSGTRTYHRMACAIEDAGFEIRDQLAWTYGSGFPKSHDLAKSLTRRVDPSLLMEIKAWLAARFEASPKSKAQINRECGFTASDYLATERGNDAGGRRTWHLLLPYGDKWAQLKSVLGFEDTYDTEIERLGRIAAQREQAVGSGRVFGDYAGTVTDYELTPEARQWQGWGTALKPAWEPICLARKPLSEGTVAANVLRWGTGAINVDGCRVGTEQTVTVRNGDSGGEKFGRDERVGSWVNPPGRFPANLIHDGSPEVLAGFPETSSGNLQTHHRLAESENGSMSGKNYARSPRQDMGGDSGSAARFFYTAKADAEDRIGSKHPTVKPVDLMQWLVRLVCPKGGTVLDPFAGTGTTGAAAFREGCRAVLIERQAEYLADIERRMELLLSGPDERARKLAKADPHESLPLFGGA